MQKKTPRAWPLTGVDTEDSRQFAHTQIEMQNKFRLAALYEISWNIHKLPSISTVIWHWYGTTLLGGIAIQPTCMEHLQGGVCNVATSGPGCYICRWVLKLRSEDRIGWNLLDRFSECSVAASCSRGYSWLLFFKVCWRLLTHVWYILI